MIAALRTDETAWSQGTADAAFSLAGAQAKTALRYEQGRWWQPYGDSPTTHILKPGIERFPDNEIIEHISQHAAALLGIDTAQTQCITVRGNHALLVTRYDRFTTPDGQYRRLHQEDSRGTSPRRDHSNGTSDRRDAATDARVAFRGPAACRGQATSGSLRVHPTHAPTLPIRQDHARPRHRLLPANDLKARCQPPRHTKPLHPYRRAIRQEMPLAAGSRTPSPLPKIVITGGGRPLTQSPKIDNTYSNRSKLSIQMKFPPSGTSLTSSLWPHCWQHLSEESAGRVVGQNLAACLASRTVGHRVAPILDRAHGVGTGAAG